MTKPRTPRLPPKRWMLLAVIQDRPKAGEEYLTEQDIRDLALTNDLIEGMKFSKIKLQPFPPRSKPVAKTVKSVENTPQKAQKQPPNGEKKLDTPSPTAIP